MATALAVVAGSSGAQSYTCSISATASAFGVYDPKSITSNDTTGTITVMCSPDVVSLPITYTVALSSGLVGTFAQRRMSSGANTLGYQLYSNAARTTVWGDGTAGTSFVGGGFTIGLLNPVSATHTVYGRIPALQGSTRAGSYSDLVTVTLSY